MCEISSSSVSLADSLTLGYEDDIALRKIIFEWAHSYDTKDWQRLEKILAPKLMIDYSIVGLECQADLTPSEFLRLISSPDFLGDTLVKTQHFMGAGSTDLISETEAVSKTQIQAAHKRYQSDGVTVDFQAMSHATIAHWFEKHDGIWKLSGIQPEITFNVGPFEDIFPRLSA